MFDEDRYSNTSGDVIVLCILVILRLMFTIPFDAVSSSVFPFIRVVKSFASCQVDALINLLLTSSYTCPQPHFRDNAFFFYRVLIYFLPHDH